MLISITLYKMQCIKYILMLKKIVKILHWFCALLKNQLHQSIKKIMLDEFR